MADEITGAGTVSDFKIYHEEFFGGFSEALEENSDIFNESSRGAIQLRPNRLIGHFEKESFFKNISDLIVRRDTTAITQATDLKMEQGEFTGVKLNRRIGPVTNSIDAFRKIGEDSATMSFMLGQQIGKASAVEMATTAVRALVAAIGNIQSGAATFDGTAVTHPTATTGTVFHKQLVSMLAKMGDAESSIIAWVMHSKSFFDLMQNAVLDKVFEVAGVTIYTGTVASFNRPIIVTDTAPLYVAGTPDNYYVLGLTENAAVVDESEGQEIVSDLLTGFENLMMRVQGEYAYNVKVRGCQWNAATANPDDAALALGTNWVYQLATANGIKGGPGVRGTFL